MKKAVAAAVVVSLSLALPAYATEIEQKGNCSADSRWSADLELEYKVFDLGFEVDTKEENQDWRFTLNHNGKRVFSETRKAVKDFDDSYSEVDWDVIRPDRRGTDTFSFRAINQSTGEICRATLKG
jgi:hypothetical protein